MLNQIHSDTFNRNKKYKSNHWEEARLIFLFISRGHHRSSSAHLALTVQQKRAEYSTARLKVFVLRRTWSCAFAIVFMCSVHYRNHSVSLWHTERQSYWRTEIHAWVEVLCSELKDTAGVSLTYQQQQQRASDSAYSNDTLNPTPPVRFSSRRQRFLSF